MAKFVVVGTDTDAGKTTFASLWLAAFPEYAYWKPLETGVSDTETLKSRVPHVRPFPPLQHFDEPVAPPLAARRQNQTLPLSSELFLATPPVSNLLIETFGSACSPLNEHELQLEFIRTAGSTVLVTSSAVGAIGRALANLRVLQAELIDVRAVVLLGPTDEYAVEQLERYGKVSVFSLPLPTTWDAAGFAQCAAEQSAVLQALRRLLEPRELLAHDLVQRDAQGVWHPYTSLRDDTPPLAVTCAYDEWIGHTVDSQPMLTIDAVSSWWTILHGHRPSRLMKALQEAANKIDHVMFAGITHQYAVEVAELLLRTTPWTGGRCFFSDNGSTAVEVALKMAYQFWCQRGEPQRTLFIGFENGYHGDTFGAMAVGRDPLFFGTFEPLLFRAKQIPVSADTLDQTLREHGSQTAAVIIEPLVQGAGGMRMHSPQALNELWSVAKKHGVLFIVDEVMTCGRTGQFWAHTGTTPDLICASKTLAGGVLPLAVTLASPEIVAAFDTTDRTKTFFHGHSFTAHPLACAVAAENLRMMAEVAWLQQSHRIEAFWKQSTDGLRALPNVVDVRITGTILAVEVSASGGYLATIGRDMKRAALKKGVLLRPLGNVLYALPPLCTSDKSLQMIVEAMKAAVENAE